VTPPRTGATVGALSSLATAAPGRTVRTPASPAAPAAGEEPPTGAGSPEPWRIDSAASPLGEIVIDATRCSACGCCARACPTGALAARERDGAALLLSVDASACGACVGACPEDAVSLRRVVDSSSLAGGRRALGEIGRAGRCRQCGQPLAGGLAAPVVGARLAGSHAQLAKRLSDEGRCAECLLKVW